VDVLTRGGAWDRFDRVVIATHSNQALELLTDPSEDERRILGAISYQPNEVVLHTDTRLLPSRHRAWSSWNYHVTGTPRSGATVTYWMNKLQGLDCRRQYLVTLNRTEDIDDSRVIQRFVYWHPVYDVKTVSAQGAFDRINGVRHSYFCGAYWGFGFHEDGVRSAVRATENLVGVKA
jgi:predicted NAD/FAD-binding protein